MGTWEQILLGIGAFVMVLFFLPGVRNTMQRSREAEERDWPGFLLPVAAVILFVVVLIMVARG